MSQHNSTSTVRPQNQAAVFPPRRDYASLSIKDLIDARDAHQVYLSTLQNVVATGIGRYLIHEDDWYASHSPADPRPPNKSLISEPRTLENSVVRPWSWPAVLVFVRRWDKRENLVAGGIPRSLYLPDGRVVPTCVVLAPPEESLPPAVQTSFNSNMLGGGYACRREHQGERGVGTFACLVRKYGTYYALTNRHVAGSEGEEVQARLRGQYRRVGETSGIAADRVAMSEVFPQWTSPRTRLALDAGLIKIDDAGSWTAQSFGIGEVGEVFDATEQSVTLDLIGCPVRAFGGASGVIEGEIRALFFRYESMGGIEYATDVLIGPRKKDHGKHVSARPFTAPGDSGTLWFYDPPMTPARPHEDFDFGEAPPDSGKRARRLRPIAMQWGGARVRQPNGSTSAYALGTFLSSISRVLDFEIVRDWSTGHDEYWGKLAHFAIGWKSCTVVTGKLGDLMQMNQKRIGFDDATLSQGSAFRVGRDGFVPLADVPDYCFITSKSRPSEGVQHFADVDIQDIGGGDSILARCLDNPANVSAKVWKAYFDGFAEAGVGPDEGCLPFRVWQIWKAMVDYLKEHDMKRFLAAAGILAHYVGDASMPFHCSYMHHGIPPMVEYDGREYPAPRDSDAFKEFKKSREYKIHSIFDETLLEVDSEEVFKQVDHEVRRLRNRLNISSGYDAAVETVKLMGATHKRLPPERIIKADDPELSVKKRAERLWGVEWIREGTVASLAQSVHLLGALWSSVWEIGGGERQQLPKKAFTEAELERIYRSDRSFIPSLSLADLVEDGSFEPPRRRMAAAGGR